MVVDGRRRQGLVGELMLRRLALSASSTFSTSISNSAAISAALGRRPSSVSRAWATA